MKVRRAMAVLGLCVMAMTAAVAGTPGVAMAAPTEQMETDDGDPGGRVRFQPDGDIVELCDQEADGWAVYLLVASAANPKEGYDYQIGGAGRCQVLRASLGAPYDLREGAVFLFRICLVQDGRRDYCDDAYWANIN